MELYKHVCENMNEMNRIDQQAKKSGAPPLKDAKAGFLAEKRRYQALLDKKIKEHAGRPRTINLNSVIDRKRFVNQDMPPGIQWHTLKNSRRIAEFESEMSRAMGLHHLDITLDKIILRWKNLDILRQVVLDGFYLPVLNKDGSLEQKHYIFVTASAGQLRTDKVQCMEDGAWDRIKNRIMCGMTYEKLNERGGMNIGKLLAYMSLSSSATDEWDFDLDHAIVVKDFEAPVSGLMDYITQDYKIERGIREVMINHTDGCGVAMPDVLPAPNSMARLPFIKGLLTEFDFIAFCAVHGVDPVIEDAWGVKHDLIAEDIKIIFTISQFKLWKYYENWDDYKRCFKENDCRFCLTNYEEEWIADTQFNYQFMQTLKTITDEELDDFTRREYTSIQNMCETQEAMLRTMNADSESEVPLQRALAYYPEMLRDGHIKESLKAIRKKRLYDAYSANIKCRNKRLFAVPDMYAACEFWFLHNERPEGLLKNGEVYAKPFWAADEADVLRSPHLSFEHAVRKFNHDPIVASWFRTNGIYTSCHDLISRVLQFDVDGDQLNVVTEPAILSAAKRNREEMDVVPLFYDANKAPPEIITRESLFEGLKRAHDYSGIGQVSNALTKLWNKPDPDIDAAKMLTMFNNYVILC